MGCDCWLCSGADPGEKDDYELDIAWHVQSHGWSVVALPEEHGLPGWAYTVGMWHTLGAPELCMFGLRVRDMHHWLNKVGDRVRAGLRLRPGAVLDDVLDGHSLVVRPVHESWHADLFAFGLDFHGRRVLPVVQLVWPELSQGDAQPSQGGAQPSQGDAQPSLWLPKDDHPPTLWTRVNELVESPFPGTAADSLVIGSRRVIDGSAPVAGVVHGTDGSWSFLDTTGRAETGTVHLRHVVAGHPYVSDFADLPPGFAAWRQPDGNWRRVPISGR
jgi:hypothetical protein